MKSCAKNAYRSTETQNQQKTTFIDKMRHLFSWSHSTTIHLTEIDRSSHENQGDRLMKTSSDNYEYSVRCSNETVRFSSALDPETMQSYMVQLYYLFRSAHLNEISLSVGDTTRPLSSGDLNHLDDANGGLNRIFKVLHTMDLEACSHEVQWVGEVLLKASQVWHTTKGKGLPKPLADQVSPDVFLQMMDELLEECAEHLQALFNLRVVRGYSSEQCARIEHISTATFHRYWRNLKCQLGASLFRRSGEDMQKVREVLNKIGYCIR